MINQFEQHFTHEKAIQLVKQYYTKEGDHFSFLEQEKFGRLVHIEDKLDIRMEEIEEGKSIHFAGTIDGGLMNVDETFLLQYSEKKKSYIITGFTLVLN